MHVGASIAPVPTPTRPPVTRQLGRGFKATVTFAWKYVVGVFLAQNFLGAFLVAGWTTRLAQRSITHQWWKRSSNPERGLSFVAFAAAASETAPLARWPNWFVQPTATVRSNSRSRFANAIRFCLGSLWRNAVIGFQNIATTWTLTLPGCVLMLFSWYAGWLNSFNKGYEQAIIGPLTGVLGIALFIAAMTYVPLAQMRHAATGQWRTFYQFKFVRALIRERFFSCFLLACCYSLFFIPVTVVKVAPQFFTGNPEYQNLTNAEALTVLRNYYFGVTFLLLPLYIGLRLLAARIYASAVLAALKRGAIHEDMLGENEWATLHRLDLLTLQLTRSEPAWLRTATMLARRGMRTALAVAVVLVWFTFAGQAYVSEFFLKTALGQGWLNQPLVQLPWFNYIPPRLTDSDPDN